jgi:hypothetical protein
MICVVDLQLRRRPNNLKIWILIRDQFGNTFGIAYKYQFATFSFEKIGQLLIMG